MNSYLHLIVIHIDIRKKFTQEIYKAVSDCILQLSGRWCVYWSISFWSVVALVNSICSSKYRWKAKEDIFINVLDPNEWEYLLNKCRNLNYLTIYEEASSSIEGMMNI